MKLFQAALQHRKSITITTEEAKALGEECVVVASSLTMLEFIANMLPVSLRLSACCQKPASLMQFKMCSSHPGLSHDS
eukprot:scaffold32705_cov18-Tisochrysis_lutea.AAC.2